MNKNDILVELYNTEFVDKYVRERSICKNDIEDKINDIWVIICDIPEQRLIDFYKQGGINKIRQFVSGIISRQCCSVNSKIYQTYDRYKTDEFCYNHHQLYENYQNEI